MSLFMIVACLLIERYLHIGNTLKRFAWFESYLGFIKRKIGSNGSLGKGFLGVAIVILPIWLMIVLFTILSVQQQLALSGAGLYFVVLLYCFGPTDLYYQLYLYFKSSEQNDKEHADYSYKEIMQNDVEDTDFDQLDAKSKGRQLTNMIFAKANCCLFGVVFWFYFLGAPMVLIYRMVCLMASFANKGKEVTESYGIAAIKLEGWLNWIPSRIMALLYVIAGGTQSYSVWKKLVWTDATQNQTILMACGVNALPKEKQMDPIEENKYALTLVNRALIIFVVVLFVFALGAWLK